VLAGKKRERKTIENSDFMAMTEEGLLEELEYDVLAGRPWNGKYLANIPEIKTLFPTEEEFADPITYIESLKDLGYKYGTIKVVPPPSFNM
jgi:hypothetical protein